MNHSAQRLTCYALISAIEADMRTIMQAAAGERSPEEVLSSERIEVAQGRRSKEGLRPSRTLTGVLDYLDFAHVYEALRSQAGSIPPSAREALDGINKYVSSLIAIRNRVAHTRPMEIDDTAVLLDVAESLLTTSAADWPELKAIKARLTSDPAFVLGLTISLPKDSPGGPQHNLPTPDFDETGFMGRKVELQKIKRRILGSYPVVSILGDGGVGKTAIALKAAYDILSDPDCPFEAIVWVTAKATILTPREIQRVSGAIETSLGLFAAAARELGPQSENPVEELYAYLQTFKILLILDNLETVLDANLREFLLDLPVGSKVLLTSRIAVGVENPVPLDPLTHDESKALLKALGGARNVRLIRDLRGATLDKYVERMAGHPAYIKWFVAGVQAGSRPEDLLGDSGLLLDFCMSNVYDFLNESAAMVLESMQVLVGPRSQAELAYLSDFSAREIQSALLNLMTTNFISMTHSSDEAFDTSYHLSDFAQQYLDKHHPVSPERRGEIVERSERLREWGAMFTEEVVRSPFSPVVVNVRAWGDVGVARLLREALSLPDADIDKAIMLCSDAQSLAPGYYEPWRVLAHVYSRIGDIEPARAAFDQASELAPESPLLAFHYGDFLLNYAGEAAHALGHLQRAARAYPERYEVLGQIAWAHYSLGDYQDAILSAGRAAAVKGGRGDAAAAALSVVGRAAMRELSEAYDATYGVAVEVLEAAIEVLDAQGGQPLRGEPGDWFVVVAHEADQLAQRVEAEGADGGVAYAARKARQYADELRMRVRGAMGENRLVGTITGLHRDQGYAFLLPQHQFFHVRECLVRAEWDRLEEGDACVFSEGQANEKGRRAVKVRLMR